MSVDYQAIQKNDDQFFRDTLQEISRVSDYKDYFKTQSIMKHCGGKFVAVISWRIRTVRNSVASESVDWRRLVY